MVEHDVATMLRRESEPRPTRIDPAGLVAYPHAANTRMHRGHYATTKRTT